MSEIITPTPTVAPVEPVIIVNAPEVDLSGVASAVSEIENNISESSLLINENITNAVTSVNALNESVAVLKAELSEIKCYLGIVLFFVVVTYGIAVFKRFGKELAKWKK